MGRAVLFPALSSSCVKEVLQFLAVVVAVVHAESCNPADLASSHCRSMCILNQSASLFKVMV